MNANIVEQMRQEEADLLRKLQAVRVFLSAYGEAPSDSAPPAPHSSARPNSGSREKVDITSFTEQTRRSVLLSLEAMVHSAGLMKTKDLVDYVEKRGHEVSGKNKVNSLGALLARSEDVEGHGKSGWTVADRERALQILQQYEYKVNEPESENASGPDHGQTEGSSFRRPWEVQPAAQG